MYVMCLACLLSLVLDETVRDDLLMRDALLVGKGLAFPEEEGEVVEEFREGHDRLL